MQQLRCITYLIVYFQQLSGVKLETLNASIPSSVSYQQLILRLIQEPKQHKLLALLA